MCSSTVLKVEDPTPHNLKNKITEEKKKIPTEEVGRACSTTCTYIYGVTEQESRRFKEWWLGANGKLSTQMIWLGLEKCN